MNVQNHAAIKELKLSTDEIALQPEGGAVAADLKARTDVAAAVAAQHAEAVDRDARFPHEAITAARTERLLGIMVPHDLGGEGASLSDAVDVCYGLGRSCASTAMIFAMHQTKVACILRHGRNSAWHERVLRRLSAEQLLMASSTTEGQSGGDVRKSEAPVEKQEARITPDGRRRRLCAHRPLRAGDRGALYPHLAAPRAGHRGAALSAGHEP